MLNKTKKVMSILSLAVSLNMVAYAAPVEFSGDVNLKYEKVKSDPTENNRETTFRLNAETALDNDWSAYARFGYRHFGGDDDRSKLSKLDQYGLKYAPNEETTVKFGVQDTIMGPFGTLIDLTDNIGGYMLKGVDAQFTSKDINYHLLSGKLDKRLFDDAGIGDGDDKSVYGLELSKKLGVTTIGGQFLKVNNDWDASTRYYGVYASNDLNDKTTLTGEYVWSNADSDNKGALFGLTYALTEKDTLGATYRNVKGNATSQGADLAGYNGEKGIEYTWERPLGKQGTLLFTYDDLRSDSNVVSLEYNIAF
jgi:hypothetical protein